MAVNTIVEILKIRNEDDLNTAISEFETAAAITMKPLTDKLQQQVLTSEVQQLELHMTFVESWRDRAAKGLMLASAFEGHGKSNHFLLPDGRNITAVKQAAYQRKLTTAATALVLYFEQLLRSIDSRVNLCKKLLGNEQEAGVNNRRFS